MLIAAAAGATLIVGGTAGTVAVIMASQHVQTRSAYCYSAADLGSQYTQVGLPDRTYDSDGTVSVEPAGEDRAAFAIDMCQAAWRAGILPAENGRIPDLVACLREDGVPAVFPSTSGEQARDVCQAVGLATLAS